MYALAEQRIFCFGKTAYKWFWILMAIAVFYSSGMPLGSANESIAILKGYIQENHVQENTMEKEQINALFLLQENWMKEINKKYSNYKVVKVKNGIIYVGMIKNINSRKIKINVSEINRNINDKIEVIPIIKNKSARSSINNMVENDVVTAVNGTYFMPNTGRVLGTLVINNEIISGPIYERAALGIGKDVYKTARISFSGSLTNGQKEVKIDNINQPRMSSSHVLIYTKHWGEKAPATKNTTRYIAVRNGKITAASDLPIDIPKDGCVINAPSNILTGFEYGMKVKLNYGLNTDWQNIQHIISGGPYLMKNGNIYIDVTDEKLSAITGRNPRTAIGYTKENVLIMVTVDGRKEGSSGVTLGELAKIMMDLGCHEAINLDGGSSTVMYSNGNIYRGTDSKYSPLISNILAVKV